jgi:hypothetical protein
MPTTQDHFHGSNVHHHPASALSTSEKLGGLYDVNRWMYGQILSLCLFLGVPNPRPHLHRIISHQSDAMTTTMSISLRPLLLFRGLCLFCWQGIESNPSTLYYY